jgi:hypothetical protein
MTTTLLLRQPCAVCRITTDRTCNICQIRPQCSDKCSRLDNACHTITACYELKHEPIKNGLFSFMRDNHDYRKEIYKLSKLLNATAAFNTTAVFISETSPRSILFMSPDQCLMFAQKERKQIDKLVKECTKNQFILVNSKPSKYPEILRVTSRV